MVAQQVLTTLANTGANIITNVIETDYGPIITINLNNVGLAPLDFIDYQETDEDDENALVGGGEILYVLNYSNRIYTGAIVKGVGNFINEEDYQGMSESEIIEQNPTFVAAGTSKLIYERVRNADGTRNFFVTKGDSITWPTGLDSRFLGFLPSNPLDKSSYANRIDNVITTPLFYANVVEQIILEHAEYITGQDLFKRVNFEKLKLERNFPCDITLLDYDDFIGSYSEYKEKAKKIACSDGFGKIPTPLEKLNIYISYEVLMLAYTNVEMLKSLFAFASFGMQALLPGPSLANIPGGLSSFYFDYLVGEIERKLYSAGQSVLNEQSERVLVDVHAALNEINQSELESPLTIQDVNRATIQKTIRKVQDVLYNKLTRSGIPTKLSDFNLDNPSIETAFGQFAAEYVKDASATNYEILKNIITTDPGEAIGPPRVTDVIYDEGAIEVSFNSYSGNPRLDNGGFFIEQGIEIIHKNSDSSKHFKEETFKQLLNAIQNFNVENPDYISTKEFINYVLNYNTPSSKYLFGSSVTSDTYAELLAEQNLPRIYQL